MTAMGNEKKRLLQTGIFRSENDVVAFLMARIIDASNTPVGAWTLKEELEKSGIFYGTATVGRYLKELDSRGMTEQISNQGRILTDSGREWLAGVSDSIARAQMHSESSKALKIGNYADLVDLIQGRKAIETAAARLAAEHATAEDIERLKYSVRMHYRCVAEKRDPTDPALDFHSLVAEISHNRFIKAILDMLIFEERSIEESMEYLLTRERGDTYVVEHDDICTAIAARDANKAESLMATHLDALLEAVREQVQLLESKN